MSSLNFFQNLRVGADALRANPLRTVLSTLGMIIGVGSLVAVLSVGDGLEDTMRAQLDQTTSVMYFTVDPVTAEEVDGQSFPLDRYPVFVAADVREAALMPGVEGLSAQLTARGEVTDSAGRVRRMAMIVGVTEGWSAIGGVTLAAGRAFTARDVNDTTGRLVVLSGGLARRLIVAESLSGVAELLGRTLRLQSTVFTIIGVSADTSANDMAWVPLPAATAAMPPTARPRVVSLLGKLRTVEQADSVRIAITRWATTRFGAGTVSFKSNEGRLQQAQQGILLFKLFMGAITGISLLVGGIGIMNVLLAAVTERTREIGIRKAVGARSRDVRSQFLAESIVISGFGSAVGVVLGLGAAFSITALMRAQLPGMQIAASVSMSTVAVAVLSAVLVGLVFGMYPAVRAARLNPIEAIRHE
ncbi:ABC transporter permease [Gemmatimonas sp.]|uniref:ABC transporter permease n=1 Tax=Gemmatimonas sp. TaxID=1962908 RepID=UPI002869F128|nr:ABC transporter permease [Gemmatimonas sp.]